MRSGVGQQETASGRNGGCAAASTHEDELANSAQVGVGGAVADRAGAAGASGDSILESWLQAAVGAATAQGVDPGLITPRAVRSLLDLARDAAHQVARPAAPLATFAVGLALGHRGGGVKELEALAAEVAGCAANWGSGQIALEAPALASQRQRTQ